MSKLVLKASIHCPQEIPCNPCETACPFGAITVGEDITALPRLDLAACRGCGICLAICPGLAIRMVEEEPRQGTREKEEGETRYLVLPYEYLPLPEPGSEVPLADMEGQYLGTGKVQKLTRPLKHDPTLLVYLEVPAKIAPQGWAIKRPGPKSGKSPHISLDKMPEENHAR